MEFAVGIDWFWRLWFLTLLYPMYQHRSTADRDYVISANYTIYISLFPLDLLVRLPSALIRRPVK